MTNRGRDYYEDLCIQIEELEIDELEDLQDYIGFLLYLRGESSIIDNMKDEDIDEQAELYGQAMSVEDFDN